MAREMKKSGIEWVGKIPINWSIRKGKYILNLLNRCIEENSGVVTCFRDGEVTLRENRRTEGFTNAVKEIGYQGVKPGDLVVHGMDGFAGAIGISDSIGKMSPIINVLDSNQNKKYLMYYLRSMAFENVFLATATGIRERSCDLRWNKLANLEYPIPPLSEQKKIADFLDEKVKEIDNAIEKTKETIEAYRNYEKALISKYIKFGEKEVPKITTQYDYIGEIAYTHTVAPLKRLLYKPLKYGANVAGVTKNTGIRYIRITDIDYDGNLKSDNKQYLPEDEAKGYLLKRGTVLFARSGGTVGKTFLYNSCEKAAFAGYLIAAESNDAVLLSEWLYLYTKSSIYENWKNHIFIRATIQNIGADKYNELPVVITSIDEQRKIVLAIKEKHNIIENIIHNEEKLIALLNNYKQSLIYEYVTGKKEVK